MLETWNLVHTLGGSIGTFFEIFFWFDLNLNFELQVKPYLHSGLFMYVCNVLNFLLLLLYYQNGGWKRVNITKYWLLARPRVFLLFNFYWQNYVHNNLLPYLFFYFMTNIISCYVVPWFNASLTSPLLAGSTFSLLDKKLT